MDNITHSLIGFTAAELIYQHGRSSAAPEQPRLRKALWFISWVGNNFPDLDFLYAWITERPLGYLLHHRGHTHTLAGVVAISALLYLCFFSLSRWYQWEWDRSNRRKVMLAAALGPSLHLVCDWFNIYGVHPFWPFDWSWYYGDLLFIVEPWLWVILAGGLSFAFSSKLARVSFLLIGLLALILSWRSGYVPPLLCLMLAGSWLVLQIRVARGYSARVIRGAAVLALLVIVGFQATSWWVKDQFRAIHRAHYPTRDVNDVMLSPLPANPFCWSVTTASEDRAAGEVILQRAVFRPLAISGSAAFCVKSPSEGTLPLTAVTQFRDRRTVILGENRMLRRDWERFVSDSCHFRAFLQFSRAPFIHRADGAYWVAGDLRFDHKKGIEFAEMLIPERSTNCPKNLPGWEEPRSDWLRNR